MPLSGHASATIKSENRQPGARLLAFFPVKKSLVILGTLLHLTLTSPAQNPAPGIVPSEMWTQLLQKTDISADNNSVSASIRELAYRIAMFASGAPDPVGRPQGTAFDAWRAQFPGLTDKAIRQSQGNTAANQWARLEEQEAKKNSPVLTAAQQGGGFLVSTILFWYSTDIRTEFANAQDKAIWQQDRIKADKLYRAFAAQYPEQMAGNWKTLMESCKLLGLPAAQPPQ